MAAQTSARAMAWWRVVGGPCPMQRTDDHFGLGRRRRESLQSEKRSSDFMPDLIGSRRRATSADKPSPGGGPPSCRRHLDLQRRAVPLSRGGENRGQFFQRRRLGQIEQHGAVVEQRANLLGGSMLGCHSSIPLIVSARTQPNNALRYQRIPQQIAKLGNHR